MPYGSPIDALHEVKVKHKSICNRFFFLLFRENLQPPAGCHSESKFAASLPLILLQRWAESQRQQPLVSELIVRRLVSQSVPSFVSRFLLKLTLRPTVRMRVFVGEEVWPPC